MRWTTLGWFLIVVGAILLLHNFTQGTPGDFALKLWPLVLVLIGLIGAGSRPSERLYNLLLILIGLVLVADSFYPFLAPAIRWWPLALVAIGLGYLSSAFTYQRPSAEYRHVAPPTPAPGVPQESHQQHDVGPGVKSLDVQITAGAGSVVVSGATDKAFIATHRGIPTDESRVDYRESGGVGHVQVNAELGESRIALNSSLPMRVSCKTDAGRVDMDLSLYHVGEVSCLADAGSTTVRIGRLVDRVTVSGRADAGAIIVEVPKDAGIRVVEKSDLPGSNVPGLGLIESEGALVSPNYATAGVKVDLDIRLGVSHFELRLV
jgi:hypothetical protein